MYEQYWNLSQVVGEIQQQDLVLMVRWEDLLSEGKRNEEETMA